MEKSKPQVERTHKTLTKFLRHAGELVAVIISVSLVLSAINGVSTARDPIQGRPYDGVSLYKAMFFTSGPLASRIPTLRKVAPLLPAEYKALEAQMIEHIRKKDPGFFDHFAKEIQSGDRVRVAEEIKRASKLQREALSAVTSNSSSQFAKAVRRSANEPEPQPQPHEDQNFAVAVITIIVVIVAVVILLAKPPRDRTELKGLTLERYADEVVRVVPRA